MGEDLINVIEQACNDAKSIEIRKHRYMDGDEQKVEYVAIARLKAGGFTRKTADSCEEAIRKCAADID